jgi:hypothetical protein
LLLCILLSFSLASSTQDIHKHRHKNNSKHNQQKPQEASARIDIKYNSSTPFILNDPRFTQTGKLRKGNDSAPWDSMVSIQKQPSVTRGLDDEAYDAINLLFWREMDGIVLELGGLDGKSYSVSRDFQPYNWHRILIEATPYWHAQGPLVSPDATYVGAAICLRDTDVHFLNSARRTINGIAEFMSQPFVEQFHPYLHDEAMKTGQFNISQVDWKVLSQSHHKLDIIPLPCVRMETVLSQVNNGKGVTHINLFILDVEGGEMSVLQSIDFSSVIFDVICVETDMEFRLPGYREEVVDFLSSKGYTALFNKGRNSWLRHKTFTPHSKANDNDTHQGRGAANITNI